MSQGTTIKGKTASGQNVEVRVDDNGFLVLGAGSIMGIRQDADAVYPGVANGQAHPLLFNELGRLKTAGAAAQFAPVDMAVSAIQAAANTPVANATAFANVEQVSNVMAYVTGTFAGMNCTFEGSLNSTNGTDGTWFTLQAVRSNANTVETTTGVLAAAPAYAWEISVNACSWFRVRCTARTSGTQNWKLRLGSYATEPVPAVQTHAVTMTSTTVAAPAATIAGATVTLVNSAASTNATALKAAANGRLLGLHLANNGAAFAYFKLYNKVSAPTVGTDVPIAVIGIPPNGHIEIATTIPGTFAAGIGYAITGGAANNDTTPVAVNQVVGFTLHV